MNAISPLIKAAKRATKALVRGWFVIPLSIALIVAITLIGIAVSPLGGIVGGVLLGIAILIALVQFYTWCWRLNDGDTVRWGDAWGLRDHIFSNIAFVGFILWITFSLINPANDSNQNTLVLILKLVFAFALNPIAEIAVLGRGAQGTLFTEAFRVTRDHLLIWFLPLLILIGISALTAQQIPSLKDIVFDFARNFQLLAPGHYFLSITQDIIRNYWISLICAVPLGIWFTLLRLALLEELEP